MKVINENTMSKREHYYRKIYVLFEILKSVKDREDIFLIALKGVL